MNFSHARQDVLFFPIVPFGTECVEACSTTPTNAIKMPELGGQIRWSEVSCSSIRKRLDGFVFALVRSNTTSKLVCVLGSFGNLPIEPTSGLARGRELNLSLGHSRSGFEWGLTGIGATA